MAANRKKTPEVHMFLRFPRHTDRPNSKRSEFLRFCMVIVSCPLRIRWVSLVINGEVYLAFYKWGVILSYLRRELTKSSTQKYLWDGIYVSSLKGVIFSELNVVVFWVRVPKITEEKLGWWTIVSLPQIFTLLENPLEHAPSQKESSLATIKFELQPV